MNASTTVVFADLTGSAGLFEALGNARATAAITGLTQWIATVCQDHGGRVVKTLGDGVLAVFPQGRSAVLAVVELQRVHARRLEQRADLRMRLQIGVAAGEVIEVDGDCYGDAVNVASRLSDLSGPDQIWATRPVISQFGHPDDGVGFRSLGPIPLRGMSKENVIFRIDWQEDMPSMHLTAPAELPPRRKTPVPTGRGLRLSWLNQEMRFAVGDMPIHLGRADEAEFPVPDQRVSRLHARIEWRNGSLVLVDMSSYGTWVRFSGSPTELALRRDECVLVGTGELALGASFDDYTVPTVGFEVLAGGQ
jgi:adenylate cyclase